MKKFSIIHIPVRSFFSKELYVDVGLYWKGVNFLYLLLLLAVCLIPVMISIHLGITDFVNDEAPAIVNQVPEITIIDGQVSIEETQPYYVRKPDSNELLAVIDTTGQTESLKDSNSFCLLTKTEIMWKKSKIETQIVDLSKIEHFVLNSERITGWLQVGKKFMAIAAYPFALSGSYLFRIVQALIYAAVGLLFASWCNVILSYAALLRLAVVAMTPCLLAKVFFWIADIHLPYAPLIFIVITLAYLFFAIKANADIILLQDEAENPEEMID